MRRKALRAARANRVLRADEKRIRAQNTVMGNAGTTWLFIKIVDCERMGSPSVRNRRSARASFRPRNIVTLRQQEA